jgi:hypothetical protein
VYSLGLTRKCLPSQKNLPWAHSLSSFAAASVTQKKKFNKIGTRAATSIETVDQSHPMTSLAKETNVCGELPKTARVLRMVNRSVTIKVNLSLSIKKHFHNFL